MQSGGQEAGIQQTYWRVFEIRVKLFESIIFFFIVPLDSKCEEKFQVWLNVTIREINFIDEVEGYIRIRFDFVRWWFDHNLDFKNLQVENLNELSESDSSKIWKPYFVFYNVESQKKIKKSDKKDIDRLFPNKSFTHAKADRTFWKNAYIFDGSENEVIRERQVVVDWICDFDITWYPFDTNMCDMKFYMREEEVVININSVIFKGLFTLTYLFCHLKYFLYRSKRTGNV